MIWVSINPSPMRIFTLIVCSLFMFCHASTGDEKPNIIYIMADDLGYGDLACYGNALHRTPNLDRMASNGIKMTDFHAAPWCAPSRRAFMTGCHPNRPWGKNFNRLASSVTFAEMLKSNDYQTAIIGKWHLGMGDGLHPLDQGFDYWYGTKGSNDWDGPRPNYSSFKNAPESAWKTPYYINRKKVGVIKQSEITGSYTEQAIQFIETNHQKPFFLFLSHNMPHVPIFASESFRGKSANGVYGDVIEELDWSTGEVIKCIQNHGLEKTTLIVFTSDNGPWKMFREFGGFSTPLRGEKSTTWEGGERVPCILYWPGVLKPSVNEGFMMNYDWYATIASFTDSKIQKDHAVDSIDMSDALLSGNPAHRSRHVFYQSQAMAYRKKDFKIHFYTRDRTREPISGKQEPSIKQTPPLLFNLKNDFGEKYNIAHKYPELVRQLTKEFEDAKKSIQTWEKF